MSEDRVKVWVGLDPETAQVHLLVNRVPVGRLVQAGNQITISVDSEYGQLRDDLTKYCNALFANMPETLRSAIYEMPAFVTNTAARDAVDALAPDRKARVHLGCGPDVRQGWLNIDYRPGWNLGYEPSQGFLNYDLRQGLPGLAPGSVETFFSSHFFEHLRHEEGTNLMRECRAALRPDGVARFQMPEFGKTFKAYVEQDEAFFHNVIVNHRLLDASPPWARNWADLVSRSVYESYTHKYIWDQENMTKALTAAGFSRVTEVEHDDAIDNPEQVRKDFSFYLEARP